MATRLFETLPYESSLLQAVERRRAMAATISATVDRSTADRVVNLARTYGAWMQPGTIAGLVRSGLDMNPAAVADISNREADRELREGSFSQRFGSLMSKTGRRLSAAGRGAVRGAFTGFDFLWEEGVSRPLRWVMQQEVHHGGNFWSWMFPNPLQESNAIWEWGDTGRESPWEERPTYRDTGRSPGLVAIQDQLLQGQPIDLGEGFFPQSPASTAGAMSLAEREGEAILPTLLEHHPDNPEFQQQLMDAASNTPLYKGKPLSMGRFAVSEIFEPDTKPYNLASGLIDAALIIALDPSSLALTKAGDARRVKKTFGVIDGHRQGVDPDKIVNDFLFRDRRGQNLVRKITETSDFEDVYLMLGKDPSVDVARRLADATTDTEVLGILGRELGFGVRTRPADPTRLLPQARRALKDYRLFSDMPGGSLPLDDVDHALPTLRNYLINARVSDEVRKARLDEFSRLRQNDPIAMQKFMRGVYRDIDEVLNVEFGKNLNLSQRFGKMWDDFVEAGRAYFIDEIGNDAYFPGTKVMVHNGEEVPLATAQLMSEMMERSYPLLNVREVRRAASEIGPLLDLPGVDHTIMYADRFMSNFWKPLALFRGAWVVRVVGDEQARMAATGLDSIFRHPLSWFAWMTGRKGDIPEHVTKALNAGDEKAVTRWLIGDSDQFSAVQQMRDAGWRGADPSQAVRTGNYDRFPRGSQQFFSAWGEELTQLARDDVARRVAGGMSVDDWASIGGRKTEGGLEGLDAVKEWFWAGGGSRHRANLADMRATGPKGRHLSPQDADTYGFSTFQEALLQSRQFADDYIDSIFQRIQIKTGGNNDLMRAIADGRFGGDDILHGWRTNKFVERLHKYEDAAPPFAKGPQYLDPSLNPISRAAQHYNRAVEAGFHALGAVPTNKLSRSPAFKQLYWKRLEAMAPFMSDTTRATAARAARAANLPDVAVRIESVGTKTGPVRSARTILSNYDDADAVAKHYALDETRRLLYSLDKRSQFMDIGRHFFPFGEAFKEIFTTWARIGIEHPQLARRAQIGVEGARGSGFFYTDPQSGDEMFGYPGGGMVAGMLGLGEGQSLNLQGRVAGLNLFSTTVIPGVGPVVSWAAGRFIPDHPDWDWLNNHVFPFGRPDAETPGQFIDHVAPAYAKRILEGLSQGAIDERMWNNTVADIANALIASGEYSMSETDEALDAAARKAQYLYLIRGMAQSIVPTGPSTKFVTEDADGTWWATQQIAVMYRELLDKHQGDTLLATQEFMATYGIDPLGFAQPRSRTLRHRALAAPGVEWEKNNPDLVSAYPITIGLFAPEGTDGDFDFAKYLDEIEAGNLEALTDTEQLHLANNLRGWLIYRNLRDQVIEEHGETDQVREYLAMVKASLKEELPGFDSTHITVPEGARPEDKVTELVTIYNDAPDALTSTEAWTGFDLYMQAREIGMQRAGERGFRTLGAEVGLRDVREFLVSFGDEVAEQHPAFLPLWRTVLSQEVR
jgi:hypothetical protein